MNQVKQTLARERLLRGFWNESVLLGLVLTGHVLRGAFESFVGVPMSRLRLLAYLYATGELSQADLQHHLEVDGATITRQVKQLEAEDLLQRRSDPRDNRFTLVALTPAGQTMVESLARRGEEFQRLAIRDIDAEHLRIAGETLAQIRSNLQGLTDMNHCEDPQPGEAKE